MWLQRKALTYVTTVTEWCKILMFHLCVIIFVLGFYSHDECLYAKDDYTEFKRICELIFILPYSFFRNEKINSRFYKENFEWTLLTLNWLICFALDLLRRFCLTLMITLFRPNSLPFRLIILKWHKGTFYITQTR